MGKPSKKLCKILRRRKRKHCEEMHFIVLNNLD
jgi:hypothetical protein